MFKIHRQQQGEGAVKKSIQKLFDPKKDVATRLKHLKNVIDNSSETEVQNLFELHYSHIYFIFFENFLLAESNLRLKGSHRAQREELDSILLIFEQILINLPELIHERWQYHSIDTIIKRLLHTQNSLKVRKEGMHFFLLWLRALRENALSHTLLLYACLIPGFPPPTSKDGKPYSLEWLVNTPTSEEYGVHQVEIMCLVPPASGEKFPTDLTKYFLDALLEFMVLEARELHWKDGDKMATKCFSFLWDLFKDNYLTHAFPDFSFATSVYSCNLDAASLPEPRQAINYILNVSDTGSIDPRIEVASGCPMLSARVSIIKWVVAFTGSFERPDSQTETLQRQISRQLQEVIGSNVDKESDVSDARSSITTTSSATNVLPRTPLPDTEASNSNTSTLTEKEPSISSLSSLDDKLQSSASAEEDIIRSVLYSTRQNINIIHELFRQAFILPLTEVPTMRKVVKVYQQWIQDAEVPVFMQSPSADGTSTTEMNEASGNGLLHQESESSLRNTSYMRGQLEPIITNAFSLNIRAGPESTYQLFITNSAHVFLVEPPQNAPKLVQAQVDVCKRVLNLYRHMVMNIFLSDGTWRQLLRVLLHVTRVMLQEAAAPESGIVKYQTVAGRLAGPVFQTLIVSWIKANLFVHVSRELWDELVDVLSSLCSWEELVTEWAKNMETMTRVLSRHVYRLELQDLPLDRLTEQKHKKRKKGGSKNGKYGHPMLSERSFSRGWSRDSVPSASNERSGPENRYRSQSSYVPPFHSTEEDPSTNEQSDRELSVSRRDRLRHRSSTAPETAVPPGGEDDDFPPHRGNSDTQFPGKTATLESNSSTLKRRNSASDISAIVSDKDLTTTTSPTRHRSDSESQGLDRGRVLGGEPAGRTRTIAWQTPTHKIETYQTESAGASETTSLGVNSIDDEDEFIELIHRRLQTQEASNQLSDTWPNEATSLNSQDSASIDPDWHAWEETPLQRSSEESDIPSSDRISMEFSLINGAENDTRPTTDVDGINLNSSVGTPVPRHRFASEESTQSSLDSKNITIPCPSPTLDLPALPPLSQPPPAIPARRALPPRPAENLCEINFLTPTSDTAELAIPSRANNDTSENVTLPDGPIITYTPTTHSSSPTTAPQSSPDSVITNTALFNSDLPAPLLEEPRLSDSVASLVASPPYQLHQNVSEKRNESSSLLLPENTSCTNSSDYAEEDDDNLDLNTAEDSSLSTHDIIEPASTSEECVFQGTNRAEIPVPEIIIGEEEEEDFLVSSSDDILLQHSTTPQSSFTQQSSDNGDCLLKTDTGALSPTNGEDGASFADERSIMAGGKKTGWFPDVAVALWRRLLGILGDVNKIEDGFIHELVFQYLLELWEVLFKMRQNIGVVVDAQSATENQDYVPPLKMLAPWAFKATMSLPDSHKEGKLHAYQLLCKMTVQREHDTPLGHEHLAQFYAVLHESLHSPDQDIVSKILASCSQYFPACLPASTLLLLDFIYACHTVAASSDLKAPRVEAQIILGSTLCFPNVYHNIPVLKPDSVQPSASICNNVKDYVVEALLASGKKEPSAAARCVALSSTGLWLYEELTSRHQRHTRVKEAINVLLVSLKFNNRTVASVACSQLHLLTHCSNEILTTMPDMPPRIIEVMSLTISALLNTAEAKTSEPGRQLIVSLLLCIQDWCMAVPLELLTETYGVQSEKRLIRTVFKALQTAALGKPGHSAKHSYSLSDLASQDFDPNLPLDKVQEPTAGSSSMRSKPGMNRSVTANFGKDGAVSLAAHTVLGHLTNHLGHFPLARGSSVLTCRVSEHHDVINSTDNLSASLFNSPDVQFLIYNDSCLLSVVEIPAEADAPGGGATADMNSSNRCVRFIVRDAGGKYCWDSSILYGPPGVEDSVMPVSCKPLSTLDQAISQAARDCCRAYIDYARAEEGVKRKVTPTVMPRYDNGLPEGSPDKLDQLLQYIGWSSPECQSKIGFPLNVPSNPPACLLDDLQSTATECMLNHHESLCSSYERNASTTSWQCSSIQPRHKVDTHTPYHHARLLCAEMGFLSRDNRHRVNLLTKNERLLRELKNLDSRHCRETHKVAVFYISEGQEDKLSVLSNTGGSEAYENFVAGLGWEVDLSNHCGFRGKLLSDGSTGQTTPYYATSTLEVIYHVATRFPSKDESARNMKIRHLGNDEVHIVWSEHRRDYRRGIIPTEFGDVLIVIYPIRHGLFRVQIIKKPEIPYFGPLFDGAIVNGRILPVLVRETAINAGRAKRSLINLYQPFYEERTRYLRQIIDKFKDERTFEDYCAHLFSPAPPKRKKKQENFSKSSSTTAGSLDSTEAQITSPPDAAANNNNNNSALSADISHRNPFKDTVKKIHNSSVFTHSNHIPHGLSSEHLSSIASNLHSKIAPSPPINPTSVLKSPSPSGAPPSFTFPPPRSINLSSSDPAPSRTHRQSASTGSRSHVSFHPDLARSVSGGLQHPAAQDLPDLRDFPSPPQTPPTDPILYS